LSDDELTELLRDAPWHRLAVIGDSMAAGVGDEIPAYPSGGSMATLARVLGRVHPDFAYLNLGERDRYAAEVRSYAVTAGTGVPPRSRRGTRRR
jgi:hypothetical protein